VQFSGKTAKFLLPNPSISGTFKVRGIKTAAKLKPVQPTEIKDKKIARQVIEQIRRPIPKSVEARLKKEDELILKFFK
jgi:hypothetical protein